MPPTELEGDGPPARIGPWRIIGVAGRGGMGAVYLGERGDGQFQQHAAIKLIRAGMDTPTLRARFLRERQILAALKHPNIATLLDGGVTETGAPYFAMEWVAGLPIDAWCDAAHASPRERVQLMLQVCAAVQHAHQHFVVHRDLKPNNILVDTDRRIRLLDFGIAKLIEGDSESAETRDRPQTPHFSAPEQVLGGDITTATDVYALGVLLHRLLCGVNPAVEAGVLEPLSHATARATEEHVRARGLTSKKALARQLRGDLSAITLRCLQSEPSRRYPTAAALAQDLTAWLSGWPVTARDQTLGYVVRRFAGRHRWGVAAVSAVVLTIAAGTAGALWQAGKARAAAAESKAQLEYLSSLLQAVAPSTAEARELDRSRLITEAARRARVELADKPASLAGVELALAKVALDTGDYLEAAQLADSAYAQRVRLFGEDAVPTAEALLWAGAARMFAKPPQLDVALQKVDAAIAILRRGAPGTALLVDSLQKRAVILGDLDKLSEQGATLSEAAALCEGPIGADAACEGVWKEQGAMASRSRAYAQALVPLRRAYEARRRRLGDEHAETLDLASMLAWAQAEAGDLRGGAALAEKVDAAYRHIYSQPTETSLRAIMRLSRLLKREGQFARAGELMDEYLLHSRALFGENHLNTVLGYSDRASLLFVQGRYAEAAEQFDAVARAFRASGGEINAALVQGMGAEAMREDGHAADAVPRAREAVETLKRLYPGGEHLALANALDNLARDEAAAGAYPEALAHHDQSIAMYRKLQAKGAPGAATAQAFRGKTLFAMGREKEAEAELRSAVEELAPSQDSAPSQYWEPFALLAHVACRNHAADCDALREKARPALELPLAATALAQLRTVTGP